MVFIFGNVANYCCCYRFIVFQERKAKLAPQIKDLRTLRQSASELEIKHSEQKGIFDNATVGIQKYVIANLFYFTLFFTSFYSPTKSTDLILFHYSSIRPITTVNKRELKVTVLPSVKKRSRKKQDSINYKLQRTLLMSL